MSNETQDVPSFEFSAAALEEWTRHVESILRGLAHALNNRAAALSAVIELSRDPADVAEMTNSILDTELKHMQGLVKVVRSIGAPSGGIEAITPRDVVPDALAALALHAGLRDRVITIDAASAPPARVARWMLLRALIAVAAKAPAVDAGGRNVRLTLLEEGDWLLARVEGGGAPSESIYAAELARAMGGEPLSRGFRIPSLAALRRREGR